MLLSFQHFFLFLLLLLLLLSTAFGFLQTSRYSLENNVFPLSIDPALFLSTENNSYEEDDALPSLKRRRRRPTRIRPVRPSASTTKIETKRKEAQARHEETLKDPTLLTKVKFAERTDIHPATKRAITEVMGLQAMTEIQAKTYAAALSGESVLGRARTGTGKTLAFLLPTVERLLETDLELYRPGRNIGAIIIAPTRELAIQIADQAKALLSFHNEMDVACLYGGTKLQRDIRLLTGPKMPTILVATPGRLLEHLDNTRINRRKFRDIAEETRIIVLDEADRLFEGFPKETQKILSSLPRVDKRQNLFFSATIPKKLRGFLKGSMKLDFNEVSCVDDSDINTETNMRVDQTYHELLNMRDYIPTLLAIIQNAMKTEDDYKVLVFFPASKLVRFFVNFFNEGLGIPVLEIHSRMSQSSRNRASDSFRTARRGILFTSDVSARGVDYPDISLVVQFGAPSSEAAYVHRLGRTGRQGKRGKGILVLLPFERHRMKTVRKRGIQQDSELTDSLTLSKLKEFEGVLEPTQARIRSGHVLLTPNAEAAYRSFLAYYIANSVGLEPFKVLEYAKEFAFSTGLAELPSIESKIATRLGIIGLVAVH